jgi:hypothetical protein
VEQIIECQVSAAALVDAGLTRDGRETPSPVSRQTADHRCGLRLFPFEAAGNSHCLEALALEYWVYEGSRLEIGGCRSKVCGIRRQPGRI